MLNERLSLKRGSQSKIDIFGLLLSTSFSLVGWGFLVFTCTPDKLKGFVFFVFSK